MTNEVIVNAQLADVLTNHGVRIDVGDEFVHTDLADGLKFKTRVICQEVNGGINSRLDVMILTDSGEKIIESFGDVGATIDDAVSRNLQNFALGSLHPILAAFGSENQETLKQVEIEKWHVNDRTWQVYIGNLIPKSTEVIQRLAPPVEFFQSIEHAIREQKLTKRLHWFRSYYCQWEEKITVKEFLMDNESKDADSVFKTLPIIPQVKFYSCRNFILLRRTSM